MLLLGIRSKKVLANAIILFYNIKMETGKKNVLVKKTPVHIMPAMVIVVVCS